MDHAKPAKLPTPQAHIKKWARLRVDASADLPNLQRFAGGEKFDYGIEGVPERFAYGNSEAGRALERLGLDLLQQAQIAALRGEPGWLETFNRGVARQALGFALNVDWHERAAAEVRAGKRQQALKMLSLRDAGLIIGAQLFLGQLEGARLTVERCRRSLAAGFFLDGDEYMPRRAQYFVLQLMLDTGGASTTWQSVATDEPVYAGLRSRWRDAEEQELIALLVAACERHVREARAPTDDVYPDFEAMEAVYFPFEIHAVLRLREQAGLANPAIEHPLTETPLGQLPQVQPAPEDPILDGVEKVSGIRLR
jgi:hypothetical protein